MSFFQGFATSLPLFLHSDFTPAGPAYLLCFLMGSNRLDTSIISTVMQAGSGLWLPDPSHHAACGSAVAHLTLSKLGSAATRSNL